MSSDRFDNFLEYSIPPGHIVVAACKDEFVKNLSKRGKRFFFEMGSKLIHELEYRMGFAFIGRKDIRGTAFEKSAKNKKDMVKIT